MTHQEALTAGAKIAGALESYSVSIYLQPRGLAEGAARGEVTVHVPIGESSIDTLVRLRDRVRVVGYDVEFDNGDLEVVGGWTSPAPRDPTRPSR